ncbi:MAG: hypothetical protein U0414_19460 [Polyangiaceae bacterium]
MFGSSERVRARPSLVHALTAAVLATLGCGPTYENERFMFSVFDAFYASGASAVDRG